MARGKYTARAATARAAEAQESVADLRAQLDAERQESKRLLAELNARVQNLQGQLVREVRGLAAAEVERVRVECASALASERAERRAKALKVGEILEEGNIWRLSVRESIAELLGVPLGELFQQDPSSTRYHRRMTTGKARSAASEIEQARGRGLTFRGKVAGAMTDQEMDVIEDRALVKFGQFDQQDDGDDDAR